MARGLATAMQIVPVASSRLLCFLFSSNSSELALACVSAFWYWLKHIGPE